MDAVEEVKSRLDIEDVISEYVQLKRSGRNYKGLSPFTSEKTPSFMVSPEKQIWHDFSSGKGGNIFSFVMEMEGLDFKGALEHLARKAGVDLSQYRSGSSAQSGKLKERLYEVVEMAAKFYQVQFSKNQKALEYVFKKRQFNKETALAFRLGYAPNTGFALVDYLKKNNVTDKELQQAGLSSSRSGSAGKRTSDMFRGRLMIPLADPQGKIVGFTARLLDDDPDAPKYINTPQTVLYDKGRHIYGLHLAKESIRKAGYAVVVEGNLDVISSHQAGIRQVVASAGTAVTEMNLKALSRFTEDIRLAFDQDKAGQAAAERTIPLAGKVGVSLNIIEIAGGKDPDELIKKDAGLWQKAIDKPVYALDWLIARYEQQLDLTSATGKRQFSDIILEVIRKLTDQVEQDHYLQKVAGIIGVSREALASKMAIEKQAKRLKKTGNIQPVQLDSDQVERTKAQNQLLALALMRPKFRNYLKGIIEEMLVSDDASAVLKFLHDNPEFDKEPEQAGALQKCVDYVKMLVLQFEATYQGLDEVELSYEAKRLQVRLIERYVKSKKPALAAKMRDADERQMTSLLKEARALDTLLNETIREK
ncbi:DNA primase [soil metagenome]